MEFPLGPVETASSTRQSCPWPSSYGRARVCNYNYNDPAWIGRARIYFNGQGHIQSGIVKLDDADLSTLTGDGIRHVVCHELGHILGLWHWETNGNFSCMNSGHLNNQSYNAPTSHDIGQVNTQTHYHGGNSTNQFQGDPANGDSLTCILGTDCFEGISSVEQVAPDGYTATFSINHAVPAWRIWPVRGAR